MTTLTTSSVEQPRPYPRPTRLRDGPACTGSPAHWRLARACRRSREQSPRRVLQQILADLTRGRRDRSARTSCGKSAGARRRDRGARPTRAARRSRVSSSRHRHLLRDPRRPASCEQRGRSASTGPRPSAGIIRTVSAGRMPGSRPGGRLIEAYETLRDPVRRRRYDLELARRRTLTFGPVPALLARRVSPVWSTVGRWVVLLLLGAAGIGIWLYAPLTPVSLPAAPVPPAPRLLDAWTEPPPAIPAPPSRAGTPPPNSTRSLSGRVSGSAPAVTTGEHSTGPSGRAPHPSLPDKPVGSTSDAGTATGTDTSEPPRPMDADDEASR